MLRIAVVALLTAGGLFAGAAPASACHPQSDPWSLGCPHCVRVHEHCVVPLR